VAGSKLSWDDCVEDLDRDLRRHGMPDDAVEQVMADVWSEVERGDRSAGPHRPPADEAIWIRHERRPRIWRALTTYPGKASTLVLVLAGGLAWDHGDWWALPGLVGVLLLEVYGIMPNFRRWADRLFDARAGVPISTGSGVRLVLGGIGYVLLLGVVAFLVAR
jgi:hypothetical protein